MADLKSLMGQLDESLARLKEKMALQVDKLEKNKLLVELDSLSHIDLEVLYQQAYDFFQEGKYQEALPLALQISALKPVEWRYLFIAGMCFQFLGDCEAAASFYGFTLMIDPACTPAAYRLAECLSASGNEEQAKQLYEAVIAMGRSVPEQLPLQDLAQKHLAAMH